MKMSKSLGNTVNPLDLMKEHGADILRLWALSVDFTEDHRIGKEILGGVADQYRKLRNTFRYLLGALEGFSEDERVGRRGDARARALHAAPARRARRQAAPGGRGFRLQQLPAADRRLRQQRSVGLLFRYPQGRASIARSTRRPAPRPTSAAPIAPCSTPCSTRWCAGWRRCWCSPPRRCGARASRTRGSVHLLEWPETFRSGRGRSDAGERWAQLRELRTQVTEAIEPLRRDKVHRLEPRGGGDGARAAAPRRRTRRAVHRLVSASKAMR